ncbi:hypothetical protein MRX96_047435 [Rhipicephalus microplus]
MLACTRTLERKPFGRILSPELATATEKASTTKMSLRSAAAPNWTRAWSAATAFHGRLDEAKGAAVAYTFAAALSAPPLGIALPPADKLRKFTKHTPVRHVNAPSTRPRSRVLKGAGNALKARRAQ